MGEAHVLTSAYALDVYWVGGDGGWLEYHGRVGDEAGTVPGGTMAGRVVMWVGADAPYTLTIGDPS